MLVAMFVHTEILFQLVSLVEGIYKIFYIILIIKGIFGV